LRAGSAAFIVDLREVVEIRAAIGGAAAEFLDWG